MNERERERENGLEGGKLASFPMKKRTIFSLTEREREEKCLVREDSQRVSWGRLRREGK